MNNIFIYQQEFTLYKKNSSAILSRSEVISRNFYTSREAIEAEIERQINNFLSQSSSVTRRGLCVDGEDQSIRYRIVELTQA